MVLKKPEGSNWDELYLPRLAQPADSRVAHPHNDSEEGIQVLELPAAADRDTKPVESTVPPHVLVARARRLPLTALQS